MSRGRGKGKHPLGAKQSAQPRPAQEHQQAGLGSGSGSGHFGKKRQVVNPDILGKAQVGDQLRKKIQDLLNTHPELLEAEDVMILLEAGPEVWNRWRKKQTDYAILIGEYQNIDFTDYDLRNCELSWAKFENCKFNGELNSKLTVEKSEFKNCHFSGEIEQLGIAKSQLKGCIFNGKIQYLASMQNTWSDIEFKGSIEHSTFDHDQMKQVKFESTRMHYVAFNESKISQSSFDGEFHPTQTTWKKCNFTEVDFSKSTLAQDNTPKQDYDTVPVHSLESSFVGCSFRWPQASEWYWQALGITGSNLFENCDSLITEDPKNLIQPKTKTLRNLFKR